MKSKLIYNIGVCVAISALGYYAGRQIALNGYECTPVEKEVVKNVYLTSTPKVSYLNKYILVGIDNDIKHKDTLVKPIDYAYTLRDSIIKDGVKLVVNGSGWGNIDSLAYSFNWVEKERIKRVNDNGTYLTANYSVFNKENYYGIGVIKVKNKFVFGANALASRNSFLVGASVGYKLN